MRSSQIRVAHSTKSSESLSLQPVSQRSRSSIRFVRQRSPQRATDTWRRHQHQNLCFLRGGVTRVLRALWFDVILVTISRRICRLGFDSIGHARHALHASKTKTCLCRRRSPLVHAMSPGRLTVSARFSVGRDSNKRPILLKKSGLISTAETYAPEIENLAFSRGFRSRTSRSSACKRGVSTHQYSSILGKPTFSTKSAKSGHSNYSHCGE